uniref:Uncharacterized protein n=1 Tax=Cannabis sativa TaxID=3483 RepID=A0A803R8A1_CANSA
MEMVSSAPYWLFLLHNMKLCIIIKCVYLVFLQCRVGPILFGGEHRQGNGNKSDSWWVFGLIIYLQYCLLCWNKKIHTYH